MSKPTKLRRLALGSRFYVLRPTAGWQTGIWIKGRNNEHKLAGHPLYGVYYVGPDELVVPVGLTEDPNHDASRRAVEAEALVDALLDAEDPRDLILRRAKEHDYAIVIQSGDRRFRAKFKACGTQDAADKLRALAKEQGITDYSVVGFRRNRVLENKWNPMGLRRNHRGELLDKWGRVMDIDWPEFEKKRMKAGETYPKWPKVLNPLHAAATPKR